MTDQVMLNAEWSELRTTDELVAFLDRTYREVVVSRMFSRSEISSLVDVHDAFNRVLLFFWRDGKTAADFTAPDRALALLVTLTFKQWKWLATTEILRRQHQWRGQTWSMVLDADLDEEQLEELQRRIAYEEPEWNPSLGPSREWLSQAIADLTPARRRLIELKLEGQPMTVACREVGVTPSYARQQVSKALRQLRVSAEKWRWCPVACEWVQTAAEVA